MVEVDQRRLSTKPYLAYLRTKYGELYHLPSAEMS